nr:ABC transporter ATP-binding protein [Echinimonas agarilytica]
MQWKAGQRAILDDVTFALPKGRFIGLIGPNGAGKTSLLRCLTRFYQPGQGCIELDAKPLQYWTRTQLAQRVALVAQHTNAAMNLSVFELVRMGLTPYKTAFESDTSADLECISGCLDKMGVLDKSSQQINTLSGGELQRVLIAKALVQSPELMLLDEPTNHLDMCYAHDVMALVRQLDMTVLASIHDVNLAAQYCDYLVFVKAGTCIHFGPTSEVFNAANLSELFDRPCRVDEHPYHRQLWMNFIAQGAQ